MFFHFKKSPAKEVPEGLEPVLLVSIWSYNILRFWLF